LADAGIDVESLLHEPRAVHETLPWDHVQVRQGRAFLAEEHLRSVTVRQAWETVPSGS
jgi:predicted RNA-binding protein with PUA-like domain